MSVFRIRMATTGDLDTLVRHRHAMFEEMEHQSDAAHMIGDLSYRKWVASMMKVGRFQGYLATSGGKVVAGGCVWLKEEQPRRSFPAGQYPYLMSMYTEPEYRRKGLAKAIVEEAMRWSVKNGYPHMTLHASMAGRKLYRSVGWTRTWEMKVDLTR